MKVAALEEWDAWCLVTTPQYARADRRNYCHQLIDRIGRTKDYLQEFVTFADGFMPPAAVSASTARSRNRAHAPAPASRRPSACARPNVAAGTGHVVAPDMPALAEQQGIYGDVQVPR